MRSVLIVVLGCCSAALMAEDTSGEALSGGGATIFDPVRETFFQVAPNLSRQQKKDMQVSHSFFDDAWVVAPASAEGRDGLGPLFNQTSCAGCHAKDGRGRPPESLDEPLAQSLVRISTQTATGVIDDPVYGGQLQDKAIPGIDPEVTIRVRWITSTGAYADGEPYELRRPELLLSDWRYGPPAPGLQTSFRVAQQVYGLGLLEAIPEAAILAHADPDDANGDGIRGRANRVHDIRKQTTVLGRFGWKAGQPTIEQQSAGAFAGDIGITSELDPHDHATASQTAALTAPNGGAPEVDATKLRLIAFYCQGLAVPGRRDVDDAQVQRGSALFSELRCDMCHVREFVTGVHPGVASLSRQRIKPYTDLLLHDMGEGLADHRPEAEAGPRDWRTPPLWGIGLVPVVNKHDRFLHDGRARGFAEAILWHGGEAQASADHFRALPKADRSALIRFIESL